LTWAAETAACSHWSGSPRPSPKQWRSGGAFLNLEHVASPTEALHLRFLAMLDVAPADEDPSNKLLDVETQLSWLRAIGFIDVDCHWKWRELALLAGMREG
jgi:hypothetical protein